MDRCMEATKSVSECTHRYRGGIRVARCSAEEITQTICVSSETTQPSQEQLNDAIVQWRKITKVGWAIHGLYSVVYPVVNGRLGQPSEVLWK